MSSAHISSSLDLSPDLQAVFKLRQQQLDSLSQQPRLSSPADNPFPWSEQLRLRTTTLDPFLYFDQISKQSSQDDLTKQYIGLQDKIKGLETQLARATCNPALTRMDGTDIHSPEFSIAKYTKAKAVAALREIEMDLLKLMNIRSTIEQKIISHHMTVTAERSKNAAADLVRVTESRVPYKDLPKSQGPSTSDPIPKSVTTLFFRHYLNQLSDQSAQSPPSSPRSSITSSAAPSTSMASAILPPPSVLSGVMIDKPLTSNSLRRGMGGKRR